MGGVKLELARREGTGAGPLALGDGPPALGRPQGAGHLTCPAGWSARPCRRRRAAPSG
jgi:hypothetical protein